MITGILLLILSCVVLTLQQQSCVTCGSYSSGNFYESAANFYPINDKEIDCTKKPEDTSLLVSKLVPLGSDSIWKDNKPAKFEEYKVEGVAQRDACAQGAADYQRKKEIIEKDIVEVRKLIASDLANLDSTLEVINCPLSAIDHVIRLLRIRSCETHFVQVLAYLDISIRAKLDLIAGWDSYLNILETCLTLSRKIENLLKDCKILCNLDLILKTLGLDPLMVTFKAALQAFRLTVASIQVSLSARLNANLNVFSLDSPINIIHNTIQEILNEKRAVLEKFELIPFPKIQENVAATIVRNQNIFIEVLGAGSADFSLANPQVVCTGWNDLQSEEISITITAKIIIVGNLDVNICAKKLVNMGRVATLALSGSIHAVAELLSVGKDGTVSFRIIINRFKIQILGSPFKIPEIRDVCGMNTISISGQITQCLLESLEECEVTPSPTLTPILNNIIVNGIQNARLDEGIEVSIKARIDAETALNALRQISLGLLTSQDPKVLAQEARSMCVAAETEHHEILIPVSTYHKQIQSQIVAKVASCQKDILQYKDLSNKPDNVYIRDVYPICHPALVDSLKIQISLEAQITRLCDSLQARIDIQAAFLTNLIAVFETNVNCILDGIVKPISAVRIHLRVNLPTIISHIVSVITAYRPTCGIIDVNFLDIDEISLNVLTIKICIKDDLLIGEQIVDLRSSHQAIIKAACILSLVIPDVVVVVDPVNSGSQQHCYVVTVGKL